MPPARKEGSYKHGRGAPNVCETEVSNAPAKYKSETSGGSTGDIRRKKTGSLMPCREFEDEPSAPACAPCVSPEPSVTLAVGVAGPSPV